VNTNKANIGDPMIVFHNLECDSAKGPFDIPGGHNFFLF